MNRTTISALNPIYLDHNATTIMEQSAQSALLLFSSSPIDSSPNFGNCSSIHASGRKAKAAIEDSREQIASAFGIEEPEDICFTASATEATNTALKGFFFQQQKLGLRAHFITTEVEHDATLDSLKFLAELGAAVAIIPVNSDGALDLKILEDLLKEVKGEPAMVSIMAANNETGVIFPWEEAAKLAKKYGALFHLDAVQAPGKIPGFSLASAPVDLASFSAHKIGGAKGVGALVIRRGVKLMPLLHGGAHERSRRAGTMNVAGIAAFGAAAKALAGRDLAATDSLRKLLEELVAIKITGTRIQGQRSSRIVNTSNFLFADVRGESLLMGLDIDGFCVSSGSACNSGSILPSHVLLAMGFDKSAAQSAIRVSLGPTNTEAEIREFVDTLARIVERIRVQPLRASLRTPIPARS
jgi:cysteine desulfurase